MENAFARDRIPPQANVAQALRGILQGDLGRNSRKQVVLEDVLLVNGERLQLDLTAVSAFDDSAPGANNGIQVLTSALSSDADYLALLQVDTNTGETTGFLQSKIDGKIYDIVQRGQGNAPLMVTEASEFVPPVTSMFQDSLEVPTDRLRHRRMQVDNQVDEKLQDQHKRRELQTSDYSYEVSIFFEMDNQFIIDSPGSANTFAEAAAYLDVIISGLNLVYEKEIDTHISINGVALTTRYDGATGTSDALAILRAAKQGANWPAGADLTHALIGRSLGGGIAYRGVICSTGYGFGISANLSGTYQQGSSKLHNDQVPDIFLVFLSLLISPIIFVPQPLLYGTSWSLPTKLDITLTHPMLTILTFRLLSIAATMTLLNLLPVRPTLEPDGLHL